MKKIPIYFFLFISIYISFFLTARVKGEYKESDLVGVKYTIKKNDNIIKILKKSGIEKHVRDSIILQLNSIVDLKKCMPGEEIYIFTDNGMNFKKIKYIKDPSNIYIVEYDNSYKAYKKEPEIKTHVDFIHGKINKNIYKTLIEYNEKPNLAQKFASIFAWEFDCNKDLRSGDRFEILIEKIYVNNEFYKYGRILYASYENKSRFYEAFFYNDNYYDREGLSLQGSIMRAPIAYYTRISSGYTQRRFHPVLKKYMPHLAIDYAAPRGTPVFAAGDGKIIRKFYDRYGGKTVFIEHANGYITEYMHLLSYTNKVKIGRYVKQGDVIGYVGRSGQTTGYHLHYAVKHNGYYVNPRRLKFDRINNIKENEKIEYNQFVSMIYDMIFAIRAYTEFPNYDSKKQFLFEYATSFNKSAGL